MLNAFSQSGQYYGYRVYITFKYAQSKLSHAVSKNGLVLIKKYLSGSMVFRTMAGA